MYGDVLCSNNDKIISDLNGYMFLVKNIFSVCYFVWLYYDRNDFHRRYFIKIETILILFHNSLTIIYEIVKYILDV